MSETSTAEPVSIESTPAPASAPNPEPPQASAAIRRCCAAWRRAYKASMEENDDEDGPNKYLAALEAGDAYRGAMPLLSGYENICDFIACTAHGILVGAIQRERSGQLLYAAQVALGALRSEPKPQKSASPGM
jgi:hypothetical protein